MRALQKIVIGLVAIYAGFFCNALTADAYATGTQDVIEITQFGFVDGVLQLSFDWNWDDVRVLHSFYLDGDATTTTWYLGGESGEPNYGLRRISGDCNDAVVGSDTGVNTDSETMTSCTVGFRAIWDSYEQSWHPYDHNITQSDLEALYGEGGFESALPKFLTNYALTWSSNQQWDNIVDYGGGFPYGFTPSTDPSVTFNIYPSEPTSGTTTVVSSGDYTATGSVEAYITNYENASTTSYLWTIRLTDVGNVSNVYTATFPLAATTTASTTYEGDFQLPNGTYDVKYYLRTVTQVLNLINGNSLSSIAPYTYEVTYSDPTNGQVATTTLQVGGSPYISIASSSAERVAASEDDGYVEKWMKAETKKWTDGFLSRFPINYFDVFFRWAGDLSIPTTNASSSFELVAPVLTRDGLEGVTTTIDVGGFAASTTALSVDGTTMSLSELAKLFSRIAVVAFVLRFSWLLIMWMFGTSGSYQLKPPL